VAGPLASRVPEVHIGLISKFWQEKFLPFLLIFQIWVKISFFSVKIWSEELDLRWPSDLKRDLI
jgi:hypothetical protein